MSQNNIYIEIILNKPFKFIAKFEDEDPSEPIEIDESLSSFFVLTGSILHHINDFETGVSIGWIDIPDEIEVRLNDVEIHPDEVVHFFEIGLRNCITQEAKRTIQRLESEKILEQGQEEKEKEEV